MKNVIRTLISGGALYLAMAACSAADSATAPGHDAGAGATLDAFADALLDEAGNPVKDAKAETPAAPLVFEEPCDKNYGTASKAAMHAFPGKTINELSALRIVVTLTSAGTISSEGNTFNHAFRNDTTYLKDGAALVACTPGETVTFILPQ